jgi:hypothetical protein
MANVVGGGVSDRQLSVKHRSGSLPPTIVIALALEPTIPRRI